MDIAEVSLVAQVAWFEHLARRGFDALNMPGALAVVSGVASNTDNGIVVSRAILADVAAVGALIDFVRGRRVPASCVVVESIKPELLRPLQARGLCAENEGVEMGGSLADARVRTSAVSGVDIVEVVDDGRLRDGLVALGWFDEHELERRMEMETKCGYGPRSAVRHWVAYAGNTAVGMATSFCFGDVVVLMHCGVVAAHRRRGIATALTEVRLAAAVEGGSRYAVLTPSPEGQLLHAHLGFKVVPAKTNRWFYLPYQQEGSSTAGQSNNGRQ